MNLYVINDRGDRTTVIRLTCLVTTTGLNANKVMQISLLLFLIPRMIDDSC